MKMIRILIVDDRDENLYLLRTLLRGHGYDVEEACHGAEALARARQTQPDLVISDILMPVMDGFALCREWKKDERLKAIPFIFYTATYTHDSDRDFALGLGAERFIVKPEEPDALLANIRDTLKKAESRPTPHAEATADTPTRTRTGETPGQDESIFLKQYNAALIRKLESKMEQLERANSALKQELVERARGEAERQKLQTKLTQSQKLESIGRLASGVAHDFNNMLQVILGYVDMALERIGPAEPLHADLAEIKNAAQRSSDLTRQLLAFARTQAVATEVLDLNVTLKGMLKMLQRLIGEDVDLAWQPAAELWPVKMDPSQIDQILTNLCVNARHAIAGVGKITIETANTVLDEDYCATCQGCTPGDYVLLAVSDNGCGMEKEVMEHLFEPFFTTKGISAGTGLGLATVYGIVRQNNGCINAYSEPGKGTTFKIYLPRHIGQAALPRKAAPAQPVKHGHETILLVEDEPAILHMLQTILERADYRVLTAGAPSDAIRLAEKHVGKIHLLMTDLVMPEMSGMDLAKRLLSFAPHLKCLFMSGYTANVITRHGMPDVGVNFLQKPFSGKALTDRVREMLDRRPQE